MKNASKMEILAARHDLLKQMNGLFICLAFLVAGASDAVALTYDANTGTTGAQDGAGSGWNTTSVNFWNGSADVAWPNTTSDTAVFGAGSGAAGSVTVGTVTANGITFATPGSGAYTLTGGTITLGGTTPTINVSAVSVTGTVSSAIAGSGVSLSKTGLGTLTLNVPVKTYTGGTFVNEGMLVLGATAGNDSKTGVIRGDLLINTNATVSASTAWSLGYGGPNVAGTGPSVSSIMIDHGVLNFITSTGGGGTSATNIALRGGTISGANTDWFYGNTYNPTVTTLASADRSAISVNFNLRLNSLTNKLTFNVEQGTTTDGVDLVVSGAIYKGATADSLGGIVKAGDGTLLLTANNTFTGGTIINGGTLIVPQGGGTGIGIIRGALTITNATVVCSLNWGLGYVSGTCVSDIAINGGTLSFTNAINGGGTSATNITMTAGLINGDSFSLYNSISSTPKIASLASASSSVISNGFNLRLSNNNVTLDVASGTVPGGTDLLVSGPITSYFNGSTKDGITKTGNGKLLLTANNAYQGTTLILGGTLQVGSSGTSGTLGAGDVTNNAALVYNRSDSSTVGNSISGTGTLTQFGSGTLVLSGTNTYSGVTIVSNGVLRLTHEQCLSTNTAVSISAGAKIDLAFNGTNTVRSLTVNGVLQVRNKVYSKYTLPVALSGDNNNGFLFVIEGAAVKGTLIRIF